jgi:hypothetical protein
LVAQAEEFIDHTVPEISDGNGRLFAVRSRSVFGAAMRPKLYLNGDLIGISKRGTIGYLDLKPGQYTVSADRILYPGDDDAAIATIEAGVDTYVKITLAASAVAGKANVDVVIEDQLVKIIDKLKVVTYELPES